MHLHATTVTSRVLSRLLRIGHQDCHGFKHSSDVDWTAFHPTFDPCTTVRGPDSSSAITRRQEAELASLSESEDHACHRVDVPSNTEVERDMSRSFGVSFFYVSFPD